MDVKRTRDRQTDRQTGGWGGGGGGKKIQQTKQKQQQKPENILRLALFPQEIIYRYEYKALGELTRAVN